ncbi:MAG: phosphate/phosphite/phosphonate ABC transporter substrate-binding protein [Solirubrobacterales bacterium]
MGWGVRRLICGLWLLVVSTTLAPASASAEEYTLGIVPQFEQRRLYATWKPIVDQLAQRSGLTLNLITTLTVSEFERALAEGRFDFVYANPYHILREANRQGYLPLVRDAVPVRGIVVVARTSPLKSVAELDGKTLAVPSPNAIGASLLIRADLERIYGVRPVLLNAKTHSSVYLHVANGLADAGGGVEKTLQEQDAAVRDALRILYTTRELPSHPIAAHPRIPAPIRIRLQQAMLALAATLEGARLLAEVPMTRPVPTSIADYRPMAAWRLDSYWTDAAK